MPERFLSIAKHTPCAPVGFLLRLLAPDYFCVLLVFLFFNSIHVLVDAAPRSER
jgi:hypothetical protein